jgi:aspartate/methionine/tyrosine aminotransferase
MAMLREAGLLRRSLLSPRRSIITSISGTTSGANQDDAGTQVNAATITTGNARKSLPNTATARRPRSKDDIPAMAGMFETAQRLITASRRSDVAPFIVMDVMAAAARLEKQGRRIVHMEVGQPAAAAPSTAIAAARAALETARIAYTEALGIGSLRARIARHYGETYGIELDPARVVVTTGSSAGFLLAFLALFEPGDRVAIARPGYPPYRNILTALGCEPVLLEISAETRWSVTLDQLLAAHARAPLRGVLIASPANPTGTMLTARAVADLVTAAEAEGIPVISDEIYHGLDYAFPAETAARVSDRAVVINSFSKYFCMTGWRVGWMVVPPELVRPIERLQQNLAISVPTLSQIAAEAAFDARAELEAIKHGYEENRRILSEGLPKAGLDKFLPVDGAFYLYADISRFSNDSLAFANAMLEEAGVAATPGIDFDPVHGKHFLRFCYAGATDEMREAVRRIGKWLKR